MVSQVKLFQRTSAYLLRSVDYGDNHRILSFFTRDQGRIDAIAWGAKKSRKRFGPALDFLNCLEVEFTSRTPSGLYSLSEVELLGTYLLIRKDYDRTWTALEWFKLLSQSLKEEAPVPDLFDILQRHLEALGERSIPRVDQAFRYHLLEILGYALELTRCARCHGQGSETASFVPSEGGLLCRHCHSPQASEIQAHFFPTQWLDISDDKAGLEHDRIMEQEKVIAEALAYYLAISKKERKTTRNHSHEFRVVGRKVGGLKTKRTDKK